MSRYDDQVLDEFGRPVPGVSIYVYDDAGALDTLTADDASPLANPVTSDANGLFYFNAADGEKLLDFRFAGRTRYKQEILVGPQPTGPAGPTGAFFFPAHTLDTLPVAPGEGEGAKVGSDLAVFVDGEWRVLSLSGVLGEAFDPLTLYEAGAAGAVFDVNKDHGCIFQDHFGLVPVAAVNDPVGLLVSVNAVGTGPDLYIGDPPSVGAGWVWDAATKTGTATASGGTLRLPHTNADSLRYVVELDITVAAGSLDVYVGASGAALRAHITASGRHRIHLVSGGAVDAGTYLLATGFTGTVRLIGVQAENVFTLWQSVAGSRPVYKVDANGFPYIDATGGKSLTTADIIGNGHTPFALPFYSAAIVGRSAAAAANIFFLQGAPIGISYTNTTDNSRISVGSSKGANFYAPGTRIGAAPLNFPVPVDCYVTAGETSVYVAGGTRDIIDDPTVGSGELRTVLNSSSGTEAAAISYWTLVDGLFYGGLLRSGTITETERQNVAQWMRNLVGQDSLDLYAYDLFSIAGQSNAMGVGSYLTATAVPLGDGAEYIDSGYLKPFKEPMQHSDPGQVSLTASAWGAFCARWKAITGRRAMILGSAFSGEGLINGVIPDGTWLNGERLTDRLASKLAAARADFPNAVVRGVIYMGGEQDGTVVSTQVQYAGYHDAFLTKLRAKTGIADLPLLICSLDDTAGRPAQWAINRAGQLDAANNNPGISMIVPFQDYVIGQGLSGDTVHLNQVALNDMGVRAADGAKAALGL